MKKYLSILCLIAAVGGLLHQNAPAAICTGMNISCPTQSGGLACCAATLAGCRTECGLGGSGNCPPECPNQFWTDVSNKNYQTICVFEGISISGTCDYRCKKNYHIGNKSAGAIEPIYCSLCPSPGGTLDAGRNEITDCYIAAGTRLINSYGTYSYTPNCYYSK